MKKNKNIITIKDIKNSFNEGKEIKIKELLTLEESLSFVDSVVSSCFIETEDEDGNISVQYSELYKNIGMFLYFPIFYIEGFSLEDVSEGLELEELYSFAMEYNSHIVDLIHANKITTSQWNVLERTIDEQLEFEKNRLIAKESNGYKIDGLISKMSNVLNSIDVSSFDEFTDNIAKFMKQEQNVDNE